MRRATLCSLTRKEQVDLNGRKYKMPPVKKTFQSIFVCVGAVRGPERSPVDCPLGTGRGCCPTVCEATLPV